jgi:hypothetical protein
MKIWECGECGQLFGQSRCRIIKHHGSQHPGNDQVTMIEHDVLMAEDMRQSEIARIANKAKVAMELSALAEDHTALMAENRRLRRLLWDWLHIAKGPALSGDPSTLVARTKSELGE